MIESKTVSLPKTMPLVERILETGKQISVWLNSFEKPYNVETDRLRLTKCELNGKEYIYHY